MIRSRRHSPFRPAAWVALFAILLQAALPLLHHPAGMALPGLSGFGDVRNLCLAPGSTQDAPGKSPAHHVPACALCQALSAIGGFAPPAGPALAIIRDYSLAFAEAVALSVPQSWPRASHQPRAPPIPA